MCAYLEQVSSLPTGGRAERSYWAERAPEVDVGEQRTGGQQQGGSLRESRRTLIHLFMEDILYVNTESSRAEQVQIRCKPGLDYL